MRTEGVQEHSAPTYGREEGRCQGRANEPTTTVYDGCQ